MASENVVRFIERLMSDAELSAEVATLPTDGGPGALARLLEVAAEADLPFTEAELEGLLAGLPRAPEGELSDDALGEVCGGAALASSQQEQTQLGFNEQYLSLQTMIQSELRTLMAVSNVMKAKHDTVKNSISNVR
jgi:hypothetical protein